MPTVVESLAGYVPDLVLRRFAERPAPLSAPEMDRFPGALLFADIQGYTALAEQFTQRGPIGSEELTDLLNTFFTQLITLITVHGGDIMKMAGDSLIALWAVPPNADLAEATHRAAQCGLAVQKALPYFEATEDLRLRLRAAVAAGDVVTMFVGGVLERWELLLTGDPLMQISLVNKTAQAGDVVLSRQAWEHIHAHSRGESLDLGAVRLKSLRRSLPLRAAVPPQVKPDMEPALRVCVPATVRLRLAEGQTGWLDELRRITALFINLPEMNYNGPHALEQTQTIMQALQTALYRYEGSINKLTVDEKGTTLIAALGLPPLAHEDDPLRGLQAAQAMQAKLRELGVPHAIGAATGRLFCGSVGSARRREYTMSGEIMALASRLMQAAFNEILCDEATFQAAKGKLLFQSLPAIFVKGKSEPVTLYRPQGETAPPGLYGPLLGRAQEQSLLAARLEALRTGQGGCILIEGDAGIGKSRLVQAFVDQARKQSLSSLLGTGSAIEQAAPYYAWQPIFSQLLSIEGMTDPEAKRLHILRQFSAEPDLLRFAPLLNSILALDLPQNEFTTQMKGQVLADNLQSLLLSLLERAAAQEPRVLFLEDAHWMDSASWKLITLACRQIRSLLFVVATRPIAEAAGGYEAFLHDTPYVERLQLRPLPPAVTLELVCRRLGTHELPPSAAEIILQKAEGNPFFSLQLAYALRDTGIVLLSEDGVCRVAPEVDWKQVTFPDNVQGVITDRIDRLPPAEQMTLKTAGVIGPTFSLELLHAVHPLSCDKSELIEHLHRLQERDLVSREVSPAPSVYTFKHVLLQETAYNLMLFAQRRRLHRAIAGWYESNHADLSPFYPSLAHHWDKAQEPERTVDYLDKAGDQALQSGAYAEAVQFFTKAAGLQANVRPDSPDEEAALAATLRSARRERFLGEAYLGLGKSALSRQHLERSVTMLGHGQPSAPGHLVTSTLKQIVLQGVHRCRIDPFPVRSARTRAITEEAVRTYERLAEIHYIANEPMPLAHAILHSTNLAESAGLLPELACAYATMSLALGLAPLRSPADFYGRKARKAAQTANERSALAWVLEVSAVYRIGTGEWEAVREMLGEAIGIYDSLADHSHWRECVALLGEADFHQGDFPRCTRQYFEVYAGACKSGSVQGQIWGLIGIGQNALAQGNLHEAVAKLEKAAALAATARAEYTSPPDDAQTHGMLSLAYLRLGELQTAQDEVRKALAIIDRLPPVYVAAIEGYASTAEVCLTLWETGAAATASQEALRACRALNGFARVFPIAKPRALLWQGLADWLTGRPSRAMRAWHGSLRAAEHLGMPFEQAQTHYQLGYRLRADDPDRDRHLRRACALFEQVGARYHLQCAQQALGQNAAFVHR